MQRQQYLRHAAAHKVHADWQSCHLLAGSSGNTTHPTKHHQNDHAREVPVPTLKCPKYPCFSRNEVSSSCWLPYMAMTVGVMECPSLTRFFMTSFGAIAARFRKALWYFRLAAKSAVSGGKTSCWASSMEKESAASSEIGVGETMRFHGWNLSGGKWSETGTAMRSHRMRAVGDWSCRSKGPCHATLYPQKTIALMIHVLCGWTANPWTCSTQITGGWMNLHSKMLLKSKSPAPRHNPWPNAAVDQSYLQLLEIEMMWGFHLHAACHHCVFMIAAQTIRSLSGWCSKAWCNSGAWHKVAECATAYDRHACRSISTLELLLTMLLQKGSRTLASSIAPCT